MKIRLKLNPGKRGTKKLVNQYGEQLVCVRYRYDEEKKKRYKTVELIIEETDWEPKIKPVLKNYMVGLKIDINEKDLQQKVKLAGGIWNPYKKYWEISYVKVVKLDIEERIVEILNI